MEPDDSPRVDAAFDRNDRGVSITVRFDETTHPKRLDWVGAQDATTWMKIFSIKTGLGSIVKDTSTRITLEVAAPKKTTSVSRMGTGHLWLHEFAAKTMSFRNEENH